MERTAKLEPIASPKTPALMRGVILQLRHLSAGTDVSSTHLVASHNSVGYGYIHSPGGDVFFDASAITNLPFDKLMRDMTVEYTLDQAPYLRTSRIAVVADDRAEGAGDVPIRESRITASP